jgi:hypothetical protein
MSFEASMAPSRREQNITLHATFPSTHPHHLCDWIVTSIVGELPDMPHLKHAHLLSTLPKRIWTISVLNNVFFEALALALMIFWVLILVSYRAKKFPYRRVTDRGEAIRAAQRMTNVGFVVEGFVFARNGDLKGFVELVAVWSCACGGYADAVTIFAVSALVESRKVLAAIGLSFPYAACVALPLDAYWRTIWEKPHFADFVAGLQRSEDGLSEEEQASAAADEDEGEHCLICWSTDDLPNHLPCKGKHLLCIDCLFRLYALDRNQCPFCRLTLYRMRSYTIACYLILIACLGATCALNIVNIALKVYKGAYYRVAFDVLVILPLRWLTWVAFRPSQLADDSSCWRAGLGSWVTVSVSVIVVFWSAYLVGRWDQANFVDGELWRELEMGMGIVYSIE